MHFLHALRGALGLDFGSHLASNLDQNSTRHRQKVPLKSTFGKTTLKVTPLSRKSMLSKLKNIAKTMEGHSKSDFSHVRNEVENTTLTPLILESFLDEKRYQNPWKIILKTQSKIIWFFIQLFYDFGSILDLLGEPWGAQEVHNEPDFAVLNGPGSPNGSKTSPKSLWVTPKPWF